MDNNNDNSADNTTKQPSNLSDNNSVASRLLLVETDMTVSKDGGKKKYKVSGESNRQNMVPCKVLLLDGTDYKIDVPKTANGSALFNRVCEHLNLMEKEYFSLSFKEHNDKKVWLQNEKPILKQIKKLKWEFSFDLKFYPQDPCNLREEISRYQVYLQIRVDILSGKLPCSFVSNTLLGGLACQSQLGDYEPSEHGAGTEYLKKMKFCPGQNEELVDKISELHKANRGLCAAEAENIYLDNVKNMAWYGVHLSNAKDVDNCPLVIGVNSSGMSIFKGSLRLHKYIWPKILNIAYKRNMLTLVIRGDTKSTKQVLSYKFDNYTTVKRFWKLAVEHHAFFRLREPVATPRGVFLRKGPKYFSGNTQYQADMAADKNKRESQNFSRVYYTMGRGDLSNAKYEGPMTSTVDRTEQMISVDFSTVTLDRSKRTKTPQIYPLEQDLNEPSVRLIDFDQANTYGRKPLLSQTSGNDVFPNNDYEREAGQRVILNAPVNDHVGVTYSKTPYPVGPGYMTPGGGPGLVNSGYMTPGGMQGDGGMGGGYASRMNTPSYMPNGQYWTDNVSGYGDGKRGTANGNLDAFDQNQHGYDDGLIPCQEDHWKQQNGMRGGDGQWAGYGGGTTGNTKTQTRTYTAPDGTIVTETRTEQDGIVKTFVEKKQNMQADADDDEYDRLLRNAIRSVTDMDENLSVEKIEITKGE